MLFDEISIDSQTIDDELYVNVEQLLNHLSGSAEKIIVETKELSQYIGLTVEESIFTRGMVQGMLTVALMLKQANTEHSFDKVSTVEDMFNEFWQE